MLRNMPIIFRQLFEKTSCTYTYLLGCDRTKKAILIGTGNQQLNKNKNIGERPFFQKSKFWSKNVSSKFGESKKTENFLKNRNYDQ